MVGCEGGKLSKGQGRWRSKDGNNGVVITVILDDYVLMLSRPGPYGYGKIYAAKVLV